MIDSWIAMSLAVFDMVFGWMLFLRRDVAVVLLGAFTALLVFVVRAIMVDRRQAALVRADRRDLRRLLRASRKTGDRDALKRYRRIRADVARIQLRQEVPGLAVLSLLLAGLLTWAGHRLHYELPGDRDPITLAAWLPASSIGELIHVVPQDRFMSEGGWIREVRTGVRDSIVRGTAVWTLSGRELTNDRHVELRFRDTTIRREISLDALAFGDFSQRHGDDIETEIRLREYLPFGQSRFSQPVIPAWTLLYSVTVVVLFASFSLARSVFLAPTDLAVGTATLPGHLTVLATVVYKMVS